jgi:hypothetical protein
MSQKLRSFQHQALLLEALKDQKILTRRSLFDAVGGEKTISWPTFKRVLDDSLSEKLIETTAPAFSKSLHSRYSLTNKGRSLMNFDVTDITTGEVLKENISRSAAIAYAAQWSDTNGYTHIMIDDMNREITVKK